MPVKAVSEMDGHGKQNTPHSPHFSFVVDYSTNGMKIDCVANKGALRAYFGQHPKCTPE